MEKHKYKFIDYVNYFPERHSAGLSYIPHEIWFGWQREFVVAEVVMQTFANKYGGGVGINYRDEWPERRWNYRKGIWECEISIILADDKNTCYLKFSSYLGLIINLWGRWLFKTKLLNVLTLEEINDSEFLVNKFEEIYQEKVRRNR